jgi:cell division transport system permease protein
VRAKVLVAEAFRSLTSNLSSSVAATITVLIAMFLFGLFIALGSWVNSWTDHLKKEVVVKVFFTQEATARQVDSVRVQLAGMPEVKSVAFVTKEEALARMQKKHPQLTKNLAGNPFGPSFTVTPLRAEQVTTIADRLDMRLPGVDEVTYKEETTERVLTVARVIGYLSLAGSAILLLASTILIANTIRLSIFSRRREIEVMKLVGATNWFVRAPFMLEGLICGLIGSIFAVLLLLLAKEVAVSRVGALRQAGEEVQALPFPVMALLLVLTSLVVGAAGSGITLRRFLRI